MTSYAQALDHAQKFIDRLDAQLLLAHVLNKPRSYFISWPDRLLDTSELTAFDFLVNKRAQGYPLSYITGVKSFWDMELAVTPDVLIPRPETELLVEIALSTLSTGARVLELATGSGAIACALAREKPDLTITATDISARALLIAKRNAGQYQLTNIEFIQSDWFENISGVFDLIIVNPPYLSETDPHLSTDIRFEPRQALVSGQNGDEDCIAIISQAPAFLKSDGWLLLEHGSMQGPRVRELLADHAFTEVSTKQDLAKLDRVTLAKPSHKENQEITMQP